MEILINRSRGARRGEGWRGSSPPPHAALSAPGRTRGCWSGCPKRREPCLAAEGVSPTFVPRGTLPGPARSLCFGKGPPRRGLQPARPELQGTRQGVPCPLRPPRPGSPLPGLPLRPGGGNRWGEHFPLEDGM